MINFTTRGNLEILATLSQELCELGIPHTEASAALILIGASSLDEAESRLAAIADSERQNVVVVGLDEYLDFHPRPQAGSYGDFLEKYQPLGVMPPGLLTAWENFGFVGAMKIANQMKLWYGGPSHSLSYAIWAGLNKFSNAASFLVHLAQFVHGQRSP